MLTDEQVQGVVTVFAGDGKLLGLKGDGTIIKLNAEWATLLYAAPLLYQTLVQNIKVAEQLITVLETARNEKAVAILMRFQSECLTVQQVALQGVACLTRVDAPRKVD